MVDWEFKRLEEEDLDDLVNWRKFVARREKTLEYIKWEYLNGPWGPVETWVADYNGEIIGQYSAQRYETFFFGEKLMASLSFDTGTHPDYRRQGIFKTLGDHFFKEEGKQNIPFSTGFPNENFWPGGKKFGWKALCPIPLYENNKIDQIRSIKSNKYEFKQIEVFDDEFKGFSEGFKDEIPIYLNRTKEYLNWRFVEKPDLRELKYQYSKYKIFDKKGEFVSYIVTKIYHQAETTFLHLVDILSPNNEFLFTEILEFLIETAKSLGIRTVSLFFNRKQPFCRFLVKNGFNFINTNRVYIIRTNNDYLDEQILLEEKNSYVTMADSDVI